MKFLKNLVIFFLIIISFDLALSFLLDFGRPADYTTFIESKNDFDDLNKVDLLFLGDSETADGLVPDVFKRKTGGEAYNFGVYQLSPFEQYYLLEDLLARHKAPPQLVVLGTNIHMFHYKLTAGKYTPLFIKKINHYLSLCFHGKNLRSFTFAGRKIYLMPALLKRLVFGKKKANTKREVVKIDHGYLKNIKHFSDLNQLDYEKHIFWSKEFVEQQKKYFIKTILLLKENNISFFVVHMPKHKIFLELIKQDEVFPEFMKTMEELKKTYQFDVYDKMQSFFADNLKDEDFLDGDHLCYRGALKFSTEFADYLTKLGYKFN